MPLTIHDIARHLGVSARTVGRVLNNHPGVGANTRQRVAAYMKQVDYTPHTAARNLRKGQSDCVGVALNNVFSRAPLTQELLSWLFGELHRIFGEQGEYIQFDLNPPIVEGQRNYGRLLLEHRCGALVVAGPIQEGDPVIERLHRSGKPYLAMGRLDTLPALSSATVDYEAGAWQAARFLLQRGHTKIGMLLGLPGLQPGVERLRGYKRAMEEAGLNPDPALIHPTGFKPSGVTDGLQTLLHDKRVTAVIDCSGVEDADSLREGARRAGRMIGQDLDMVVWTYSYRAAILPEASAHIWLPVREAASEGLEQLADWFYGRRNAPVQILYDPVLYDTAPDQGSPPPAPLFRLRS